jgi:hypothetical protein
MIIRYTGLIACPATRIYPARLDLVTANERQPAAPLLPDYYRRRIVG